MAKKLPSRRPVKKVAHSKQPVVSNPFQTSTQTITPGKLAIFYGPPGVGKTTTAAWAPNPLFVCTHDETGIYDALEAKVVPPSLSDYVVKLERLYPQDSIPPGGHSGWTTAVNTARTFCEGKHDRRTLVYDTGTGLQGICHQHTASELFNCSMDDPHGFMNYQQGYLKAAEHYWQGEFLQALNEVRAVGYNVILICHATTLVEPNLGGSDFEVYAPALIKGAKKENIYDYTLRTASAVLYFGKWTTLSTDEKSKRKKVGTTTGFIGTRSPGWYVAKNWYNLDEEVEVGSSAKETWSNLNTVLPFN